jgi:integrase
VFAKAVKRAAAKAQPARRADFERLEFHDLRHTFASLMIAAGANPLQLAEALGHTDKTGARPDARAETLRPPLSGLDARGCGRARPAPKDRRVVTGAGWRAAGRS